jgi:7,8-dihydroneopterin aldolase/epimerase/oxygenase
VTVTFPLNLMAECRRLFLRGFEVRASIGVHDFEKSAAQRVTVDVDLYVELRHSTSRNDRLDEVVDYDFIRRCIFERVAQGHIHLQETLCDDLLNRMLARPEVRAVRVCTAKPDVYADCDAVGCERFAIKEST